jgi:osmotically-inducible protein OsmY
MTHANFRTRRVGMALAACALAALAACSKEVEDNAQSRSTVGAKIDRAVERTQEKLQTAGERAKEEVSQAAEKTQEAVAKAGEKITDGKNASGSNASTSPPYSPRQAVQDPAAPGATVTVPSPGTDAASTTTTLSSGPTTSVKVSGIPPETRTVLNDTAISAMVKADLLRDPDLSVLKIDVDTRDGVVTLNGLAGTEPAKVRAEKMAQSVKGVKEVRNFLTVKQG